MRSLIALLLLLLAMMLIIVADVALRNIAILSQPVIPMAAGKLLDMLGVAADARGFNSLGEAGRLAAGTPIAQPQGLFPRFVEEAAS